MSNNSARPSVQIVKVLLGAGILSLGLVVWAQTVEKSSRVKEIPVTSKPLPDYPGHSLTAVEVDLAPGAKAAKHHHAGIVFAYVLEGNVRSQLNGGEVIGYQAGQYWVEPPGAEHTLTQNPSRTKPARLLAVLVASTGAELTTYDK